MKKVLSIFAVTGLLYTSSAYADTIVLNPSQMDIVTAGGSSNFNTTSYKGTYRGDLYDYDKNDVGNFTLKVRKNGTINGKVVFKDGGKTKVRGAIGNEGMFGISLLGQRKNWGIGNMWGYAFPDGSISGHWSRPNLLAGYFYGHR